MAARLSNGSVYSLKIPEADYTIALTLEGFKKVLKADVAAGKGYIYGAFVTVQVKEPLSGTIFFDQQVRLGAVRTQPATAGEINDAPVYDTVLQQLFSEFTTAIDPLNETWAPNQHPARRHVRRRAEILTGDRQIMSLKSCLVSVALATGVLMSGLLTSTAMADVVTAKGVGTVSTRSGKPTPDERQQAILQAEANALDHYVAENDSAKQRIYDSARSDIVSHLDKYVLSETILVETADAGGRTYTVTLRAEINQNALDNFLGDSQGLTPTHSGGQDIALVFVSRSRSLVQTFDNRVHTRSESEAANSCSGAATGKTKEGEAVGSHSVNTSGTATGTASHRLQAHGRL